MKLRFLIPLISALFLWTGAFAADGPSVKWNGASEPLGDGLWRVSVTASIRDGMHIYDLNHPYNPTAITFDLPEGAALQGGLTQEEPSEFNGEKVFFDTAVFTQLVSSPEGGSVGVSVSWQACTDTQCGFPEDASLTVPLPFTRPRAAMPAGDDTIAPNQTQISEPDGNQSGSRSLWALILEAILWGFAMLLTPCVFPMVPMTVSYFLKGDPRNGRLHAFVYGLFIILLYTVPISIIIAVTRIIGGEAVTADIFNWLATHWLPNLVFFIVFMVFAASFFGAFEITLPSSWQNRSDARAMAGKGLGGIFFMALTLVLVSFSCTGPIVGSVLIRSTQGEFWAPMVTMLAFSTAFALPFTLLALFPAVLKKMRSGGWLNSVKVVMGFIEVALGFKFLSVADQTYHWGILDREVYLAIWIVVFTLLGFYLLGKIRFRNDEKVESIGVVRLSLAIAVFSFVVYMIPGMFGAPLKALSGYLPPMSTQDFVIGQSDPDAVPASNTYNLHIAQGLPGYFNLEEGLAEASRTGKPVFLDITGHGCTNCREMEARVWSDPAVLERLRNNFVIVALYTDDKQAVDPSSRITTASGKTLKTLGAINSWIARERFGVNAQPNYLILSPEGNVLAGPRGYNLSIPGFIEFLDSCQN